jgi:DNA/RNA-binding domain of Phe-tRNA-synthetase-like protein
MRMPSSDINLLTHNWEWRFLQATIMENSIKASKAVYHRVQKMKKKKIMEAKELTVKILRPIINLIYIPQR